MFTGLVPISEGSGWHYLDEDTSVAITAELKSEIGPEHFLYEWIENLVVIAKSGASDDVIAADSSDFRNLFWVHLTWSGKIDQFPGQYPSAGRIPNSDLLTFFLDEMNDPAKRSSREDVIGAITRNLEELEASDDIVICASNADAIARKLADRIEAASGKSLASDGHLADGK